MTVGQGLLTVEVSRSLSDTPLGRTPLHEWSARRRDIYPTAHNTQKRQTSMPPVGFEPVIPASQRTAVDRRLRPRGHWDPQLKSTWCHMFGWMLGWITEKKKNGRNVQGSGRNLILGTIPAFFQNKKIKHNSFFFVKQLRFTYFHSYFGHDGHHQAKPLQQHIILIYNIYSCIVLHRPIIMAWYSVFNNMAPIFSGTQAHSEIRNNRTTCDVSNIHSDIPSRQIDPVNRRV